jgi:phage gpG-like protein
VIVARLVGDDKVLARLRAMPADINSGLVRAITKLAIDLQRNIQQTKLAGEVLAVRSGSLKSSIDVRMDERPAGIAATVFSDSDYAHAHEFGFTGAVNVKASLRRITEAFGRSISAKTIDVRAHSRAMNLPERSFLRSALEEISPTLRNEVDMVLRDATAQ